MREKECVVIVVPNNNQTTGMLWTVEARDSDGDFVAVVGQLQRTSTGATLIDPRGWQTDFEDLFDAIHLLSNSTVIIPANKLN